MIIRPNPNNGDFTVELIYVTIKTTLEIFDHRENCVFQAQIMALETTLGTGLSKGNYIAKILENGSVTAIQKLVIQ